MSNLPPLDVARCLVFNPTNPQELLVARRSEECRNNPGMLEHLGGSADPTDASIVHTAVREINEEAHIRIHPIGSFLLIKERLMSGGDNDGRLHRTFGSLAIIADGIPLKSAEHTELSWRSRTELLRAPDLTDVSRLMLHRLLPQLVTM